MYRPSKLESSASYFHMLLGEGRQQGGNSTAISLDGGILDLLPASTIERGEGQWRVSSTQEIFLHSGVGFLDHMFHALVRHSGGFFALHCDGDLFSKKKKYPLPPFLFNLRCERTSRERDGR